MAVTTESPDGGGSGGLSSGGSSGLNQFVAGGAVAAADLNAVLSAVQQGAVQALLAGVLQGGVLTAAALVVTIPSGTVYIARAVWKFTTAGTVSVPDASTTYLWGCSDGQVRQTATNAPPNGFDYSTACLLTKAVATAGVAVLDNTLQVDGRYANPTTRIVREGPLLIDYVNRRILSPAGFVPIQDVIPLGEAAVLAVNNQVQIFNALSIQGSLSVQGRLRVIP